MRNLYYLDTETVGLQGPVVLIQFSRPGEDKVIEWHVWDHSVVSTMHLIETIMDVGYVGYNTVYDHFKLQQLYCLFWALGPDARDKPPPSAEELIRYERRAVFGPCLKPREVIDLYSYVRKGPYQKFLSRESVWIFDVPEDLGEATRLELEKRRNMDPMYFNGLQPDKVGWKVEYKKDSEDVKPGFVHLCLRFKARLTLKTVHQHIFGSEPLELPVPKELRPWDRQKHTGKKTTLNWGWLQYTEAVKFQGTTRRGMWPDLLEDNCRFWRDTESTYAEEDITMLRDLDRHFGFPEQDDDSTLTALVASVRYRGFRVDRKAVVHALQQCRATVEESETLLGCSLDQHVRVRNALLDACEEEIEQAAITSTKDEVLKQLVTWDGPVAALAQAITDGRHAKKKANWLGKLVITGRFHPSLMVVGTNTDRMSGSDSFNPQGIDKDWDTRALFLLHETFDDIVQYLQECDPYYHQDPHDDGAYFWFLMELRRQHNELGDMRADGGDFDSFETALAIAIWVDKKLEALAEQGIKPYWVFGSYLYADVLPPLAKARYQKAREAHHRRSMNPLQARKRAAQDVKKYNPKPLDLIQKKAFKEYSARAKNCWYALVYGAQEQKVADTARLTLDEVLAGYRRMGVELPDMKTAREKVFAMLRSLNLEEHGFTLSPCEPKIANLLGYERDFTREIDVISQLHDWFTHVPQRWRDYSGTVTRNENKGPQSLYGAVISASIGAAMRIQSRMQRQGTNFQMQSSGAQINKQVQCAIWEEQPVGVHPFLVVPLNVHDEDVAAVRNSLSVYGKVQSVVDLWKPRVPLIKIEWKEGIGSWAEK